MAEIFNFNVQDNRSIQFPKANLLEPIMQEDHNVAIWRFRIPKVLNDIDMSTWAWWFVYVNAKGQKFTELLTLVDDIDEPDEYCTADYSIDYRVSYNPGSFAFSLESINADVTGAILQEWHTKTYYKDVDRTLQGNQAQWAETESDIISALIIEVQNKVRQLVGGATPEPKSLIADMTDTKKVYLYVGSETGESTNYWYYYNGSAWVAGGLYASGITVDSVPTPGSNNAVSSGGVYEALQNIDVTTDTTLSVPGKPADAKAVGDALADIDVETDTTLSVSGKPADAKEVGDALSELITKEEHDDGNVVNMENAIINVNKNLQNVPPIVLNDGLYYSNPFVTTNTVILTFKPVDSEGNAIGMTKNGQSVSVIGEGWGLLHTFTVTGLEVVKRSYSTFHNYEINWQDGSSPETYTLESAPDHWVINGYARAADSDLNVGLTNGAYNEEYVPHSEPYYTWEPTGLLEKYPYITVDSESEFADETKIYKYNESLYFYDGEKWTEIANADSLDELDALKSDLSKNKEAVSQLVAEISQNDGNVVNMENATINVNKNLQNIPPIVFDNGVYYSNPFVTTNTVILTFKPVDSEGNAIGMTKGGQAVSVIGEGWGKLHTFTVSDLTVVAREYTTPHNFEINWGDGFPQTYTLESAPDHWVINGYARAADSDLNVGLTKGSYDESYVSYSEPYYEWEPVKLLKKYPYIIVNSEEEFTDETKVYRYNGYLYFYDGEKWTKTANVIKSNFLTIAHRGYGETNLDNALISFINAANVGFRAVEIDCRQTADGIYVAAHGDVKPLYSNGQQQSYTISTTPWADLKGKTLDSQGKYPLATVAQVFNTLRHYDMEYFIIDIKTGTNKEIMSLANRCGVADQIMLSYYSMDSLIADLNVLKRYPSVAIRFSPGGTQGQFEQIREALPNMLYSDINISSSYATLIPNSLSWGIPILCSGVQTSTIKYMAPIAAGAMSEGSLQYSPSDFHNMIALDYNQFPSLSADKQSINLTANSSTTIAITSSIDDLPCYAFAYSSDLAVFRVSISAIGATSTFTVIANNQGTADLIAFTATGEQLIIPVTVA